MLPLSWIKHLTDNGCATGNRAGAEQGGAYCSIRFESDSTRLNATAELDGEGTEGREKGLLLPTSTH